MNLRGARYFYELCKGSELESISGLGSSLKNTIEVRAALPQILTEFAVRTILDCPCGDWNWMQTVDLSQVHYLGADIIPEIISSNQSRFGASHIRFEVLDITEKVPPYSDLIICRDLLFHLSLENQEKAITNFRASGSRYILTTTFPWVETATELTQEELERDWGWRMINVELPPIGLADPLVKIRENVQCKSREMRVYAL